MPGGIAISSDPRAVALQAAPFATVLPSLNESHRIPYATNVSATFWVSNASRVAPHFDMHDNVACVVHGERRFTLFPPEQIENLYIGPTLDAPGGVPISTVDLHNPDLTRFPKFEHALASAQFADLLPGDAIYIPSPWWHAVEAKAPLNFLANFWWQAQGSALLSANQSLMHAMLSIGRLPKTQRMAWKTFFDYLVFKLESDPTEHLPEGLEDVVTTPSDAQLEAVLAYFCDTKRF